MIIITFKSSNNQILKFRCFIEGCDDIRLLRNQTPRFVDPAINVTTGQPLDGWMGPAILGAIAADMNRTVDERLWKCSYQRGLFNATPPCANRESYKPGEACSKGWVYLTNSQDDRVPIQSSITTDVKLYHFNTIQSNHNLLIKLL